MSQCSVCQAMIEGNTSGQLCARCKAKVLSQDVYTKSDLQFVGFLAGVLTAAILSMPGAFVGNVIGRAFDNGTRGCTIGVVVFALAGLVAGFRIGPAMVLRMEAAKRVD